MPPAQEVHVHIHVDGLTIPNQGELIVSLDELRTAVEESTTVSRSAIALMDRLADALEEKADDPDAIRELVADLRENNAALAAAVSENTPADGEEENTPTPVPPADDNDGPPVLPDGLPGPAPTPGQNEFPVEAPENTPVNGGPKPGSGLPVDADPVPADETPAEDAPAEEAPAEGNEGEIPGGTAEGTNDVPATNVDNNA